MHTRIRHRCSSLKADLFRCNIVNDPACACGWVVEDAIHFLLECNLFYRAREQLKDNLSFLREIEIGTLLFGNDNLSIELNRTIFKSVQWYIKETKRFDMH